jgi:glutamate/tyrosine decarboxylase-like PLP-dependent enzyme
LVKTAFEDDETELTKGTSHSLIGANVDSLEPNLDPCDWPIFRRQAHRMLDDMLDYVENIRERPVWQPIPSEVRARFQSLLPEMPSDLAAVHQEFMRYILPFSTGNVHPGFLGWVHGGGTPVGMVAEMLAAGLNANLGGRDHMPIEVERQIVRWMSRLFGFPESATGLVVSGTSMANLIAIVVARDACQVGESSQKLVAYASVAAHECISKAMEICGLGSSALRRIPVDRSYRIDLHALGQAIAADRSAGLAPFLVVGTAGTADTGAVDNLDALADICRRERLWFHVDGAYGAWAILAPELAPKLKGLERADSLAFDFHKWGQVPYDAGFVLVRDGAFQHHAFAASATYLMRNSRGLAAGSAWPCDYGPELSRSFRALKIWFTLKVHGLQALGASIARSCALARYLETRIDQSAELELLAPVELNVVCFRYMATDSARVNARIVVELQESGLVAPSSTVVDGHFAIRAAIVNHRTSRKEIDKLVDATLAIGCALTPASDSTFERACRLAETGRNPEARDVYIELLAREPGHRLGLNNLGTLLHSTGYRTAARSAYTEAVQRHPSDPMSLVNLGNVLYESGEFEPARERYETALRFEPGHAQAHQGLAYVLAELGDEEAARRHRRTGFAGHALRELPYRGRGSPLSVLLLVSSVGGNIPTRHLLDDHIFRTYVLVPEFYDFATPLPTHDIVWNAIGDADLAGESLLAAQSVVQRTSAPVINSPANVLQTRRTDAHRFSEVPGLVTPVTITLPRTMLHCHGLGFPLLVRTPGFHTGRNFVRVERPDDLASAVERLPGKELTVIQYLDARGADGKFRKYRVMMIDGHLFPLHLAISSDWKVHYFAAEMAENESYRAQDAEFLEHMPDVLGARAMDALAIIQTVLGLDYGGIDFGLSPTGDVLLFEANATMVVNPPEAGEKWEYRRAPVQRIFAAVRSMLTGARLNLQTDQAAAQQ